MPKKNRRKILIKKILKNSYKLWNPIKYTTHKIKSNSWFDLVKYDNRNTNNKTKNKINNDIDKIGKKITYIKCRKIKLYPTCKQKNILLNWFNLYIKMYNETLKIFKYIYLKKIKTNFTFRNIRTNFMMKIKKKIMNANHINSHILDGAIKDACSMLKSCMSNIKNRNIKHFRLRYLKINKSTKVLNIGKELLSKNKNVFCSTIFKNNFKCENNYKLNNIKSDFKLHFNSRINEFILLIPIIDTNIIKKTNNKTVSLDPGIRTFQTCYSTDECLKIGNNLKSKLSTYITKIDKVNNDKNIKIKNKKKVENKCYNKIDNLINDLHWKTINYLINNYGTVLIGNLSTKNIVSNKSNNYLNKKIKRIALLMKLFVFKQRLRYKCEINNTDYKEINEAYTSKICSNCSFTNFNLNSQKIFNCIICKNSIDRDFNGAKNIMLLNY